jgi:hypothetical protein
MPPLKVDPALLREMVEAPATFGMHITMEIQVQQATSQ